MFFNKVPRSNWPKGCFRVTAWHKDEHLARLFIEIDRIAVEFRLTPGAISIPSEVMRVLATRAVSAPDVYVATACLEPLYDAFESFPEIFSVFEDLFATSPISSRRRICCCLGYVLAGGINRRDPLGRHFAEISLDYAHFKGLWDRAEALRISVETVARRA